MHTYIHTYVPYTLCVLFQTHYVSFCESQVIKDYAVGQAPSKDILNSTLPALILPHTAGGFSTFSASYGFTVCAKLICQHLALQQESPQAAAWEPADPPLYYLDTITWVKVGDSKEWVIGGRTGPAEHSKLVFFLSSC